MGSMSDRLDYQCENTTKHDVRENFNPLASFVRIGRPTASTGVPVPFQPFQQSFRGPLVTRGIPVEVVGKVQILNAAVPTHDIGELINDRDVSGGRHALQVFEDSEAVLADCVCREDHQ